jgi:hypothetical protein
MAAAISNTRATEEQLRALANRLAPSANSKRENNAVAHALILILNKLTMPKGVIVSRSRIAGSQGKGTSLEGSDIDFVRYVAHAEPEGFLPPAGNAALLQYTADQLRSSVPSVVSVEMREHLLVLEVDLAVLMGDTGEPLGTISVDLLYARDFQDTTQTVAAQACGALRRIRRMPSTEQKKWSICFTELSRFWMKAQTSVLRARGSRLPDDASLLCNTVRLAKDRMLYSSVPIECAGSMLAGEELYTYAKKNGISSYVIEVLVVFVANAARRRAQRNANRRQRKIELRATAAAAAAAAPTAAAAASTASAAAAPAAVAAAAAPTAAAAAEALAAEAIWQLSITDVFTALHKLVQEPDKMRVHFPPQKWVDASNLQVAALVADNSVFISVHGGELSKIPRKEQRTLIMDPANPLCNLADSLTLEGQRLLVLLTAPERLLCEVRLKL